MIFMGLVLKIPVVGAAWLIWHAIRSEPDPAEALGGEGGSSDNRHFRREPKRPRDPRRGPHTPGSLPIPCPEDDGALRVHRGRARPRIAPGTVEEHRR